MKCRIQFVTNKNTVGCLCKPRKIPPPRTPYNGPLFKRPDGVRDPLVEYRTNLDNGIIRSWGC